MSKILVLASNNKGKLKEFAELFAPLDIEVRPQGDFGVPEAEEPHCTFVENALAKARHAALHSGLPALADDSGLAVPILGGAPGVYSARYAGEPKSDERNNALLLQNLADKTDRRSHFVCVLALVRHPEDPQPLIAEGEWHGEILPAAKGEGGFGYDPLFWVPDQNLTAAEMPKELKNTLSHRAQAFRLLVDKITRF